MADLAFFERQLLAPDEPPACDRCRRYMVIGFSPSTGPRVCRDCKQTLIKRSIMANNWRELYNAMREELSNQYGDSADQVDALERYPHWPDDGVMTAVRWISTEDQLPPDETPVLIIRRGVVAIGELRWEHPSYEETYQAFRYWDDPNNDGQDWEWADVTHWMALPAVLASAPDGQ
jgi:hypothetical protein